MAAGNYTFIIEQGATTDFEIQWDDSSGNPVDLSNYHGRMQISLSSTWNKAKRAPFEWGDFLTEFVSE